MVEEAITTTDSSTVLIPYLSGPTTQELSYTQIATTTTIRLTRTSVQSITVRNTISVAKRVEDASSTADSDTESETTPSSIGSSWALRIPTAAAEPTINPFGGSYESFQLGAGPAISSSSSSSIQASSDTPSTSWCPTGNGTVYTSPEGRSYRIVCDVDYLNNDLRFILASSFEDCVQRCDTYNMRWNGGKQCAAALFVPSRMNGRDNCYLKSSVNNPTAAELGMAVGILLLSSSAPSTSSVYLTVTSVIESSSATSVTAAVTTTSSVSALPVATIPYASATAIAIPTLGASRLHGPSFNKPSKQYIDWKAPANIELPSDLLRVGVNSDLSTAYPISLDTGILELNASTENLLRDMKGMPHISRDGGKGGYLNGQHLFIFCDTGAYTPPTGYTDGKFLGFVSSSVAVDKEMNGLDGQALVLEDGVGEWSDDVGRMRGFSPMTQGEQSYNLVMQGDGKRYAVWPQSSLIPLDGTTAIMFAPIIYDDVDMATKAAVFTYTGAALLTISAGGKGGPVAARTVDKLFQQEQVEWGCIGGIRSWGPSGVGGTDGKVYLFGKVPGGLLLARVGIEDIANVDAVKYLVLFQRKCADHCDSTNIGPVLDGITLCHRDHRPPTSYLGLSWMLMSSTRLATSPLSSFI